ncbi:dihydroneopterin aldolase [Neptunicella marina]|uniref:7,8-dihydroneopterin aldolase n=1 Tax=Neptunicella marina TaxID=2125989 RepID=A0A8J6LXI6_9ALTE|nr:dihydroneopterin aldolase [Neptunicella marina]MBC3764840.1 dihydroneopterin aldolase [Neptunicella marina]
MDKIVIEGLQIESLIGVYDWERTAKTALFVDLTLEVDLYKAGQSDDVNDTLDYAKVAELVCEVAAKSKFELLEALAESIISHIFAQFNCHQVELKLSKPGILPNASNVAVIIVRKPQQ